MTNMMSAPELGRAQKRARLPQNDMPQDEDDGASTVKMVNDVADFKIFSNVSLLVNAPPAVAVAPPMVTEPFPNQRETEIHLIRATALLVRSIQEGALGINAAHSLYDDLAGPLIKATVELKHAKDASDLKLIWTIVERMVVIVNNFQRHKVVGALQQYSTWNTITMPKAIDMKSIRRCFTDANELDDGNERFVNPMALTRGSAALAPSRTANLKLPTMSAHQRTMELAKDFKEGEEAKKHGPIPMDISFAPGRRPNAQTTWESDLMMEMEISWGR